MKSVQRRISRALVIGVSATLGLGLVFWLYKYTAPKTAASNQGHHPTPALVETPIVVAAAETKVAAASTQPVAAATTQQATMLAASVNTTTKPAADSATLASSSASPLIDAKSLIDSGKPLTARKILNTALLAKSLSDADIKTAKQLLNQINATVVFSSKRFPDDEFGGTFNVPPGGVLAKIAASHDVTPDLLMRINGISDPRKLRAGQNLKVLNGPFHAIVYKGAFTLELWLGEPNAKGSMYITSFPVGLGKDDSTPTGVWAIQNKLKNPAYYSPRGEGIIPADDPKNPLGEYWIGLTGTDGHAVGKTSYGIHGTIDPTSIGKRESMGCIRLVNEDIARVFEMLAEGKSTVTVKD
jgi:lipoprotein-anchoring transpeptidase ErfK/SrfK